MLLLCQLALAGDILLAVGEEELVGGENYRATWARAFPAENGQWHFFRAAGGDYQHHYLDSDLSLLDNGKALTGRTDLVDHAIARCPDGTFLHVGTTNSSPNANDGAWVFRYDENLDRIAEFELASGDATTIYNDSPTTCTGVLDGALFTYSGEGHEVAPFIVLDENAEPVETVEIVSQPNTTGSALLWENESQTIVLVRAWTVGPKFVVDHYDSDMNLVGTPKELQISDSDQDLYWPQALLRLGDYYVLAYMERNTAERTWSTDTGNVWVAVFDLDFNFIEKEQITDYAEGDDGVTIGAMQPWLARSGDTLLVLYDRQVQPTVTKVEIDPALADQEDPIVDTSDPGTDNLTPVADGGGSFDALVGDTIVLDGSGSYDDDGDELTFVWTVNAAPDGSSLTNGNLLNADTDTTSFVADVSGIYRLELTVSDGRAQASDTVVVTVGQEAETCGCSGAGAVPGMVVMLAGLVAVSRRR